MQSKHVVVEVLHRDVGEVAVLTAQPHYPNKVDFFQMALQICGIVKHLATACALHLLQQKSQAVSISQTY